MGVQTTVLSETCGLPLTWAIGSNLQVNFALFRQTFTIVCTSVKITLHEQRLPSKDDKLGQAYPCDENPTYHRCH